MISEESFRIARRNSMGATFIIFVFYYTKADLSDFGFLGVKWGATDSTKVLHILWLVYAFYFIRYCQFVKSYGAEKFSLAKGKVLRDILWDRCYEDLKSFNVDFEKYTKFSQDIKFELITKSRLISSSNKNEYFSKPISKYIISRKRKKRKNEGKGINFSLKGRYSYGVNIFSFVMMFLFFSFIFIFSYLNPLYSLFIFILPGVFFKVQDLRGKLEVPERFVFIYHSDSVPIAQDNQHTSFKLTEKEYWFSLIKLQFNVMVKETYYFEYYGPLLFSIAFLLYASMVALLNLGV